MENINKDFTDLFNSGYALLEQGCGINVNTARRTAFEHFIELGGIPQEKEKYKYAPLMPLFKRDYKVNLRDTEQDTSSKKFTCEVTDLTTDSYTITNGRWSNTNGNYPSDSKVIICSFQKASVEYPDIFTKYYNKISNEANSDALIPLNTAFAQDGLFVYIPDNIVLNHPLQLINLLQSNDNLMSYQRNLIVLGKHTQATILVCDHTLTDNNFLFNNVTEIYLEDGAQLDFNHVQNQHLGTAQINSILITQFRNSIFNTNIMSLYGGFIRNNIYVGLKESGANCNLYGLYISDKDQVIDNYSFVDHAAPHCTSKELFKGILKDNALANFCGSINVRPDAQKTEAYQTNNNLLLSDDARLNTKPQLVIDANDVKCSHGATVGQIDEEAMFYLRSRGIGADEAHMLMMFGFAHDIIQHIGLEPLRHKIDALVEKRLRGKTTRCYNCVINCAR